MITLSEAFKILDKETANNFSLAIRKINVKQSLGRVLANDQYSQFTLPAFDKSAMDGYAILAGDECREYKLLDTTAAGNNTTIKLEPGTCAKVMTGAPVPDGTGKVIPREFVTERNGIVKIFEMPKTSNISRKGENLGAGDLVLSKGSIIGSIEMANLIGCGIEQVKTFVPPKVMIVSTGDEIVEKVKQITPGKIMNTNGPMLQILCKQHNLQIVDNLNIKDDYNTTISTLKKALAKTNLILVSGGVSMGDFDFVTKALHAIKLKIHFNRVAVKPGRPMTFATGKNKLIFGLPGNPVSAYITFHLFVLRALGIIYGKQQLRHILLPLGKEFIRKDAERTEYIPCQLLDDGNLMPIEYHGSGHLSALLLCDGFFVINQGVMKLEEKKLVKFLAK